ncbi:MAG: leucyl/phenylalanyl-tRNA--protein transferase [Halioglobus sp.]|nr:leucyl/phenylalanyl-tRNA--protein transferase [Halioglobus sp.]
MRPLPRLHSGCDFPPSCEALQDPNGLLAVGGDLSAQRLIAAYRRGIFPWYEAPQPLLWWTPDPRSVLFPDELHVSSSLRKTLRKNAFELAVDQQFTPVVRACAASRGDGIGTWIDTEMMAAYSRLQQQGLAHSIEVMDTAGKLVGGLYGVSLGRVFFGESMFSAVANASKVAFVALVSLLRRADFHMIDCQIESEHLNSLGARSIKRADFEQRLRLNIDLEPGTDIWRLPATSGGLL